MTTTSTETMTTKAERRRLRFNVADLRRRLGQRRDEHLEVTLDTQQVLSTWTADKPVEARITLESIERGVSVTGSVVFEWEGDCRRCLETVNGQLKAEIDEIFQVEAPKDSEIIDFDGIQIDLWPVLSDVVGLALPLAPLCSDDCAGPDPERYPSMTADDEEEPPAQPKDPRWAALDQLDL